MIFWCKNAYATKDKDKDSLVRRLEFYSYSNIKEVKRKVKLSWYD